MRRQPTGKRLLLTSRDTEIFKALARYRYLRSTYLHAFAGGASETRFKERLGDLFHEGYLDRPEAQWRLAGSRHVPVIYELGKGGRDAFTRAGTFGDERRVLLGPNAHRQFEHSVMVCEVLASIELAAMTKADLRFVPLPEILAKAPESARRGLVPFRMHGGANGEHCVIPDAIFGLEYRAEARASYRFFALEADRGTMPIERTRHTATSYGAKLRAYKSIISENVHRSQLGVPNLIVLTVTTSSARKDAMLRALAHAPGDFSPFLFAAAPALTGPDFNLIHHRWDRRDGSGFIIDRPGAK